MFIYDDDESHLTFKEEKLVYYSDNHVFIEMGNHSLLTSYVYISNGRAIKVMRYEGSYFLPFFFIVKETK